MNTNFEAAGIGPEVSIQPGQAVDYAVAGTWTGFAYFEKSLHRGQWEVVAGGTEDTNFSGTLKNEGTSDIRVRIRAEDTDAETALTGTVESSITDANDTVAELKDKYGRVWAKVTDNGIELQGNVSVAGTTTLVGAITAPPVTSSGVGAANGATVSAAEYGDGVLHKTVLTLTATPVTITDDAGVAQYGGAGKVYDFPEGLINVLGAVVDGAVTLGTTGTITDTWAGGVALGTATATTGNTLTGTEADIMPEVDVAAATSKVASVDAVSVATALTESGARWIDGTGGAKDMYLNLVVDDHATHTSGTGTFTGTITFTWINLGDK